MPQSGGRGAAVWEGLGPLMGLSGPGQRAGAPGEASSSALGWKVNKHQSPRSRGDHQVPLWGPRGPAGGPGRQPQLRGQELRPGRAALQPAQTRPPLLVSRPRGLLRTDLCSPDRRKAKASVMAQWQRTRLPVQKMPVRSLGGKIPWKRKWQPLQSSCLENATDRGAWWAAVHGVAESRT